MFLNWAVMIEAQADDAEKVIGESETRQSVREGFLVHGGAQVTIDALKAFALSR